MIYELHTTPPQAGREPVVAERLDPRALSEEARDRLPARVEYTDATHAVVFHKIPQHENAELCAVRLRAKGFTVTFASDAAPRRERAAVA